MSYYCDGYGYGYGDNCNPGLGFGVRIGIGVGAAVVGIILVTLCTRIARRHAARRHGPQPQNVIPMAYQNNHPSNYHQGYNNGYNAEASLYGRQQPQAYGPPPGTPPADDVAVIYAPPPGPPPPAYMPRDERKKDETP